MKQVYLFFLLNICTSSFIVAQNLIYNPSFELVDTCPPDENQIHSVQNWILVYETPNYFNSCSNNNNASVPTNFAGFQQASIGNAYAGLYVYGTSNISGNTYREYIGTSFNSSLTVGTKYYVSFNASPTTSNQNPLMYAVDKIGILFTTNFYSPEFPLSLLNHAQIYSDTIINNTNIWTSVSGSFVADSAYNFITLGNFFADSLTQTASIGGNLPYSYYYIDDVCVSTDSLTCALFTGTNELEKEKFEVYPNPANEKITVELAVGSWQQ